MESIYITEPGAYIRRQGDSLRIYKSNELVREIPAAGLKRLVLAGYLSLSGSVLDFLIKNRIETVFITPTGRFRARLILDEHRHVELRQAQYIGLSNPEFKNNTARIIVCGKITNSLKLMMRKNRERPGNTLKPVAAQLKALLEKAETASDIALLNGIEGAAARCYFAGFPHLITNERFEFHGRNRRPPKDPVNAMLSFIYTLLTNEVLSAINTVGLDPYLGALHEIVYGRPSLACDLVEEYRSLLGDRFVLNLINRRMVTPDDFVCQQVKKDGSDDPKALPVLMKPMISRTFILAYEELMNRRIHYPPMQQHLTYRGIIGRQVRNFAEYLQHPENPYVPLTM